MLSMFLKTKSPNFFHLKPSIPFVLQTFINGTPHAHQHHLLHHNPDIESPFSPTLVTAHLLVIAIQGLRVPGEALQSAMEQFGGLIRSCVEYMLEVILEVTSEVVGLVFDLVKEGVFGSVAATGAAAGGLVEKMRSAFDGLTEEIPAVVEGAVEMVTTMVTDLWNNYMDAQSYVTENA